ncbi:MAG: hypothetical protein ACKO6B_07300 [Planctomycetia bacterium]
MMTVTGAEGLADIDTPGKGYVFRYPTLQQNAIHRSAKTIKATRNAFDLSAGGSQGPRPVWQSFLERIRLTWSGSLDA